MSTGHDDLDAWKRQRTVTLAFELADSGRYEDFTHIAYAMRFERGLPMASSFIDDSDVRRELNRRCASARESFAPIAADVEVELDAPEPSPVIEATPPAEATPSFLRRAAAALWRSGSRAIKPVNPGDLNSAAS